MIKKILVSTDHVGGGHNDVAVEAAAELARVHDAELVVVAQASPPDLRQVLDPDVVGRDDDGVTGVTERFAGVRARVRRAKSGDPVKTVVDVAVEEEADVVVMTNLVGPRDVPGVDGSGTHGDALTDGSGPPAASWVRRHRTVMGSFYADRLGWSALLLTSFLLTYGGGAVMFWLHAIYRGERGPAINNWSHWLLDSTLGFVALTPVLFLVLPGGLWILARGDGSRRLALWSYVVLVGAMFAFVTGPGPLLHNAIAGQGTWLADLATTDFGHDAEIAERNMNAMTQSHLTEGLLQIALGLPVYVGLAWLALGIVKTIVGRRSRSAVADDTTPPIPE